MEQTQNIQGFRKLVDEPLSTWPGALVVLLAVLGVGFVATAAAVGPLDDYAEEELAQTLPVIVISLGASLLAVGVVTHQVAGAVQLRIDASARAVERLSEPTTAAPTTPADDALSRRFAGELAMHVETVSGLRRRLGLARRISAGLVSAAGLVLVSGAVLSFWALPVLT